MQKRTSRSVPSVVGGPVLGVVPRVFGGTNYTTVIANSLVKVEAGNARHE